MSPNQTRSTMKARTLNLYRKFRACPPWMRVGFAAQDALDAARTVETFEDMEHDGLVRIRAEYEQENYFDVYGDPGNDHERDRIADLIDREGLWWVTTETADPGEDDEWSHADSVGMCMGSKPTSPFHNPYVVDMMRAAIKQATNP